MSELVPSPEEQIELFENLKPNIGRFVREKLFHWGLGTSDIRLVDEAGFICTGIPIYGSEILRALGKAPLWSTTVSDSGVQYEGKTHIDFLIRDGLYTGPRSPETHPVVIALPLAVANEISKEYDIDVSDLIKGSEEYFSLPTISVKLGDVDIFVPEPVSHVKAFTFDTILNPVYNPKKMGKKMLEWYRKLELIRDVSLKINRPDVSVTAEEMIELAKRRFFGNFNFVGL